MIELSTDQQDAISEIIEFLLDDTRNEIAISGGGGVGKSFLVKYLLETAREDRFAIKFPTISTSFGINVALTSTTNKAAAVLAEATGEPASTIHKLFNLRVAKDFETGETKLIRTKKSQVICNTLIFIDEVSMINDQMLQIIREQTHQCKIIFIGDSYQLAPVKSKTLPVFEEIKPQLSLTTIHRQARNNTIIPFAQKFRDALDTKVFPKIESFLPNVELVDNDRFKLLIDGHFSQEAKAKNFRILAWRNARVHQFNKHIRELNGHPDAYAIGEFVLTNNPIMMDAQTIFHTDQQIQITGMTPAYKDDIDGWDIRLENEITVFQARDQNKIVALINYYRKQKEWIKYFYMQEEFADLRPSYCSTVDKSQGSTFDTVFIDVDDIARCTHDSQIARLMYVAISRASNKVFMRGDLPARLR